MSNETPKFRPEGEGIPLSMLDVGYTPVYYGFNCRPRQVRYYKVENSVEEYILKGRTSKSVALAFLAKLGKAVEKANLRKAEMALKATQLEEARKNASGVARQAIHKQLMAHWNAESNHGYKVDALNSLKEKVVNYIAE